MDAKRFCAECSSYRRMVDRAPDETLCAVCAGERPHPALAASMPKPVFRMMRGAYDEPVSGEIIPGQGSLRRGG